MYALKNNITGEYLRSYLGNFVTTPNYWEKPGYTTEELGEDTILFEEEMTTSTDMRVLRER